MTQAEIEAENAEVWKRVRLLPLLTNLVQSVRSLQDTAALCQEALFIAETQEEQKMATTDALLAAANRFMTASNAQAAANAQAITADEATIAEDHATIIELQNHQVDDALVAKFNDAAAVIEASLPPADDGGAGDGTAKAVPGTAPALVSTITTTATVPGSPSFTLTVPANVALGDTVPVPTENPNETLAHTVTAIDPATSALTITPAPGAAPVTGDPAVIDPDSVTVNQ